MGRPRANIPCFLYKIDMTLRCAITEEQNTRGRKIHKPEDTLRCFGILNEHELPMVGLLLIPRVPTDTGKPVKIRQLFPVREKSGNFGKNVKKSGNFK